VFLIRLARHHRPILRHHHALILDRFFAFFMAFATHILKLFFSQSLSIYSHLSLSQRGHELSSVIAFTADKTLSMERCSTVAPVLRFVDISKRICSHMDLIVNVLRLCYLLLFVTLRLPAH